MSDTGVFGGNWIVALAQAVSTAVDINYSEEITTSYELFALIDAYFAKSQAYTQELNQDAVEDFVAKLSVTSSNPGNACAAAAADEKYAADSQDMSSELGKLNTMIEEGKNRIIGENNAIKNNFSIISPFANLMKLTTAQINKKLA